MTRLRTEVYIATTFDRTDEARELLNTLRDTLALDGGMQAGVIEQLRPASSTPPDAPTWLVIYLAGDVKDKIESRLAAMQTTFDVRVEVWDEFNG